MITVSYHRQYFRVQIEGHAESGEVGHDLVCASCSILAHTLATNVVNWADAKQADEPGVHMFKGCATISCRPRTRYKAVLQLVMDAICSGFELLAQSYPEYIQYSRYG